MLERARMGRESTAAQGVWWVPVGPGGSGGMFIDTVTFRLVMGSSWGSVWFNAPLQLWSITTYSTSLPFEFLQKAKPDLTVFA